MSTDRQTGMGIAPIPSTAISRWIEANGLQPEADAFRECIRAMDRAYLGETKGEGEAKGTAANMFAKLARG